MLEMGSPCMAIYVSVQHNGGLPPGVIRLTQLSVVGDAMKRCCICSLCMVTRIAMDSL